MLGTHWRSRRFAAAAARAGVTALALSLALAGVTPGTPLAAERSGAGSIPGAQLPGQFDDVDLTGRWLLRHEVLSSERDEYEGLELLFRVDLVQRGRRISGTAEKWRENGRAVAPAARSRLEIDGTVVGEEIVGRYVEVVGGRRARGSFRWRYSLAEGLLLGTFRSNVANTAGASRAVAIG